MNVDNAAKGGYVKVSMPIGNNGGDPHMIGASQLDINASMTVQNVGTMSYYQNTSTDAQLLLELNSKIKCLVLLCQLCRNPFLHRPEFMQQKLYGCA
jgi:hypothetical protein